MWNNLPISLRPTPKGVMENIIAGAIGSAITVTLSWILAWLSAPATDRQFVEYFLHALLVLSVVWVLSAIGWRWWHPSPHIGIAPAITPRAGATEQLCKLWLYERELKNFSDQIDQANAAKASIATGFSEAMMGLLDARSAEHLECQMLELMKALETADAIYGNCFRRHLNMAMNPYFSSQIPIARLEELPTDKLKREFRKYHDRLDSMARHEPRIRRDFWEAIKKTQEAIGLAATQAIENDKRD